jgi:sec-independent protein translocase protein TatA
MLAFFTSLSGGELMLLLVVGLLLFGRDLPQVGKKFGKTVAQFRRGLQDFKDQIDRDADMRDLKQTVHELKRAVEVPAAVVNPGRYLSNLTDEALSSPAPESPTAAAAVPPTPTPSPSPSASVPLPVPPADAPPPAAS